MGFRLTPDDLDSVPDHTDTIEAVAAADPVDEILTRHLGDDEHGRFVTGFLLVTGDTLLAKALCEQDEGDYDYETVYKTTLSHEVDSYGGLWDRGLVFRWGDRMDAQRADLYINGYSSHFSLGSAVDPASIEEYVESTIEQMETDEAAVGCRSHDGVESAHVDSFGVDFQRCPSCHHPVGLVVDDTRYTGDEILTADWLGDTVTETTADGTTVVPVSDDSPLRAHLALHYGTWLGRWETDDFDVYVGDRDGLLYVDDGEIVGYLLWGRFGNGAPVLQQVYVRPEHRGEGVAHALLDHWYANHLPEDSYLSLRPNDAGEEFLRDAGHLSRPGESIATPVTAMSANDQVENPEEIEPAATVEQRFD